MPAGCRGGFGIRDVGYRAIESLRLEKGYLYWSSDVSPDYSPIEAGLGGRVHLKSKGRFQGSRGAGGAKGARHGEDLHLCRAGETAGLRRRTIWRDGRVVSLASSAGFGHTIGHTILYGYLSANDQSETHFEVEVFGERYPLTKVDGPLYDPMSQRLKA